MGTNDDDTALNSRTAVRHGIAGGDGGGYLERQQGFAAAVVTVEQSNTGQRKAFLPEPTDGLGFDIGKVLSVEGEGGS